MIYMENYNTRLNLPCRESNYFGVILSSGSSYSDKYSNFWGWQRILHCSCSVQCKGSGPEACRDGERSWRKLSLFLGVVAMQWGETQGSEATLWMGL